MKPIPMHSSDLFDFSKAIKHAATGDQSSFELVVEHILPTLYRRLGRICEQFGIQQHAHSRDLTHDTLIKALDWLRKNPDAVVNWSWIDRIAMNTVVDFHRNSRRFTSIDESLSPETPGVAEVIDISLTMQSLMELLDAPDQRILQDVAVDGKAISVIAAQEQASKWAIYKRYERALCRLRILYEHSGLK